MRTNQTPGPWHYGILAGEADEHRVYGPKGVPVICTMSERVTDNAAADAALISAAPELLAVLVGLVSKLESFGGCHERDIFGVDAWPDFQQAHAAIAKATGEWPSLSPH